MRLGSSILVCTAVLVTLPTWAWADDAGRAEGGAAPSAPDAGIDAAIDGGGSASDGAAPNATPLACDGALCDTTNDSACAVSAVAAGARPHHGATAALLVGTLVACLGRRARRGTDRRSAARRT